MKTKPTPTPEGKKPKNKGPMYWQGYRQALVDLIEKFVFLPMSMRIEKLKKSSKRRERYERTGR